MWLLHTKTLELRHFTTPVAMPEDTDTGPDTGPRYAILSHVWEDADHAQSFQDIRAIHARCVLSGEDPRSLVTGKVRRFCLVAEHDGYEWVWLDTGCIDKTSSAELSEAINSMWAWYRDAAVCYAYLGDVGDDDDPRAPGSEFRRSKWYTRGWTLQELIAPHHVVFLSHRWTVIGTKASLLATVAEVTGIDGATLAQKRIAVLTRASVAKRMSWASTRRTSRIEDRAYSLLGIFGVSMPIVYGEGLYSFTRLQIEILKHTQDHSIFAWGPIHPDFDVAHAGIEWPEKVSLDRHRARGVGKVASQRSWDALLASSPSNFELSGDIVPVSVGAYTRHFGYRPDWNYTFTSNGILITLPLSTDYARPHFRRTVYERVYAAALCCSTFAGWRDGESFIVLFLILESSDVDPVPWCRRVGTESTEAGDLSFYRGALLASPSSSLSRDFVTREMSIGASQNYRELAWRKPKIPPSSSYRFLIPHWVVRRLHYGYGFNIQWSGPISHDGYHITEASGSLLPLDSSLLHLNSNSAVVFDVRFLNVARKETLIVEFGLGCACPWALRTILQPQHWWVDVRTERGCFVAGKPSSDSSSHIDQFMAQGPKRVPRWSGPGGTKYVSSSGCSRRHLAVDPLQPYRRQSIKFTHLHRTVHVHSVLSAVDARHPNYAFQFAPSPIVIMLTLEGFDAVPADHPTIFTRDAPLPGDARGAKASSSGSTAESGGTCGDSSRRKNCAAPAMARSTLRDYWRSALDWIGSEVDYTYGSLV
ncbi:HET-domain-containing protein [Lentinus brumalis]|uniref:HET-domain-containing protein n=1 Tax=Lentinus brumalis TaxID=2498619 RepID=A0A371D3X1_9APHY|nr:HET-domain-containing protein [Polyporus brumalis]